MRILQINCVYGKGSTGNITRDIHRGLIKEGYESFVLYGRGATVDEENVFRTGSELSSKIRKVYSMLSGSLYGFSAFTNRKLEAQIRAIRPDVVHLQCVNGYFVDIYRLMRFLKERGITTVLTLHADFMYTGGCGYARDCDQWVNGCNKCPRLKVALGVIGFDRVKKNYAMMRQAFDGFDRLTVVGCSEWVSNRARMSDITKDCNILTIHNGIEVDRDFYERDTGAVREKYHIPADKKVVITVVPSLLSEVKGGPFIIQLAKKRPDYFFMVIGAEKEKQLSMENLRVVPYISSRDALAELYSAADVFVQASKIDNYPTVCLEANCCGTPIVAFDVGGVKETIAPGMGEAVPYGDVDTLMEKIAFWTVKKKRIPDQVKQEARYRNSKERMVNDYIQLYRNTAID